MGQLGGGGAQTAWGYQCVSPGTDSDGGIRQREAGLAAGVGSDVPLSCLEWLEGIEIDISGIKQYPGAKTPRAWQILEQDGRRHEIWRTEQSAEQAALLLPPFSSLPPAFQQARAFHLGIHPEHPPMQLLKDLRHALDEHHSDGTGLLSIETFTKASNTIKPNADLLWAAISLCDIFSVNEEEARSILGIYSYPASKEAEKQGESVEKRKENLDSKLRNLTSPFIKAGASWCTLRRGAHGAVVHEKSSGNAWSIPAVSGIYVVDTTGCGNAFCGAFLAGIQTGMGAEVAGKVASAAASVMAEHQGVPQGLEMGDIRTDVSLRAFNLESVPL